MEGARSLSNRFAVCVSDECQAQLPADSVSKLNHLGKFIGGINMEQAKRDRAGSKGLLRQPKEYRRIFANRIKQRWAAKLRGGLSQYINALSLQHAEVRNDRIRVHRTINSMHSFYFRTVQQDDVRVR